jgi:RimJ/RimL family protein N-acetyltransferase
MAGRFCRLEAFDPDRHAAALYAAYCEDSDDRLWTYLSAGPFPDAGAYRAWMEKNFTGDDPLCFTILDPAGGEPAGTASYMRIDRGAGSIEVGSITYAPRLQKTAAATEAMYLMMRRAFDELGYRRYEWNCDALNAASRAAAERLGFTYEGLFRQATVYKQRNRDTAWFSIIDSEWPVRRAALEAWLDPANFDADGVQKQSLAVFRLSDGEC